MTPSELIKAARTSAGITQAELALRLGVKKQNLNAWERGRVDPSATTLLKIIELCNYKIE